MMLFFKKDKESKAQKSQKEFIGELDSSVEFSEMSSGFLQRPEIERIQHAHKIKLDFEENKETIMRARRWG